MSKLKPSKAKEARYSAYKLRDKATINKQRRIAKHLKKHPNDLQAQGATKATGHTRKTPTARLGWVKDDVKNAMLPKPPSRHVAREVAQVLCFSKKVLHTPITKKERPLFKEIYPFDPKAVKERAEALAAIAKEEAEKRAKLKTEKMAIKANKNK